MIKLSDKQVQALKPKAKPYRVNDDNGLSCFVAANGKKFWRFRYQWLGREKMLSMGEFPATSLALARKKRDDARTLLAQNIDPSADRQKKLEQAKVSEANTFQAVGIEWFSKRQSAKTKNGEKIMADATGVRDGRILAYLYKELGFRPIAQIDGQILLAALHTIEARGSETAHRARSLAGKVFRFAITQGKATRDWSVDIKDQLTEVGDEENRPAS